MKKLAISAAVVLGACCPKASVNPVAVAHAGPAWTASTVDLGPTDVHARLGAPTHTSDHGGLGVEECFAVTAPFSRRCVRYVDGLVLHDNVESQVPATELVKTFNHVVAAATATDGAPDDKINFVFTPGDHVLAAWQGRDFRFGESCILENARKAAIAVNAEGLKGDSPELEAAALAGTACVHANWNKGITIGNREIVGDAAVNGMYALNINYRTQDATRQAHYKAALNADVQNLMKDLEKLDGDLEDLKTQGAPADDESVE